MRFHVHGPRPEVRRPNGTLRAFVEARQLVPETILPILTGPALARALHPLRRSRLIGNPAVPTTVHPDVFVVRPCRALWDTTPPICVT